MYTAAASARQTSRATTVDELPETTDAVTNQFASASVEAAATEAGSKPTQMRDHCMVSDDHSIDENAARRRLATELTAVGATACARQPSRATTIEEHTVSADVLTNLFPAALVEAAAMTLGLCAQDSGGTAETSVVAVPLTLHIQNSPSQAAYTT